MAKQSRSYICLNCQQQFPTWSGRCNNCQEWNTLVEYEPTPEDEPINKAAPAEFSVVKDLPKKSIERLVTGIEEFDRVLGGTDPGFVPGSVILLSGNPGVGKSTLLLQVATKIDDALYLTAEESLEQIQLRANRLGLGKSTLAVSSERRLPNIVSAIQEKKPPLIVIDSIQTIFDDSLPGTPGSMVQVREACWRLQSVAKQNNTVILLVGHVTKEGVIAGPKVLEHLVDVVMYLEGERQTGLRLLRCEKNRFGSTEEVGIWSLTEKGFESVDDPGELFASMVTEDVPGRALTVTLEGSRAFLVEIQALTTKTNFGYPKRVAQGLDANRLNVLLAVLESRLNLPLSQYDVYVNVVGGFSLRDPGTDLAIAGAIISSLGKRALPERLVLIGEVGLLGEVRPPTAKSNRLKEITRLNYSTPEKISAINQLKSLFSGGDV